ncbi:DUF5994 family protein [Mycolicibacterium aubagnense]|nr:DUF5994 family protein [Mycolicibacterium aubagnense]WGI30482.1 DUF5994 family protein [Mycolicibacterium aubagnense]
MSQTSQQAPPARTRTDRPNPTVHDDALVGEPNVDDVAGVRVRITNRLPSEHIDGAWWPCSTDLVAELPALLSTLTHRLGQVVMVGYVRNGWTHTPPEAEIAGQTIELLAFDSAEPASVILVGQDGHHLTLRVISPQTRERDAQQALAAVPERSCAGTGTAAAAARSLAEVAGKLADHEGRQDDRRNAEIMRWCEEAAAHFDAARIQTYVPILVEHIVRNRMYQTPDASSSQPGVDSDDHPGADSLRMP